MARKPLLEIAAFYTRMQWKVVPVPFRKKMSPLPGWSGLRLEIADLPRYFSSKPQNIGVLLGEPSNWLIDVDLDHPLAVEMAENYLPRTNAIFGRCGKPRSHWLYYVSESCATQQYRLPDRRMVVELRSTGAQTVFPGSVHESGESIEWAELGEPATVEPSFLRQCVRSIYDEVLVRLEIPPSSARSLQSDDVLLAPQSVITRARKYLAKLPPAVSGQGGHDATFHAACVLVIGFGLGRSQALQLFQEWNECCDPPWSEKELEHKVDDALKQPGWRGYLLSYIPRPTGKPLTAIERANRHAIEHRAKLWRRVRS